jgi:Uma2 family endonuclease
MPQTIKVIERDDFPDLSELPEEDGIPLESDWHRLQINLLDEVVTQRWRERDDFFAGGNMFIYYSPKQARNRDYRGPDFFVVKNIDGSYSRQKWVVWEEKGRYPDVIIELMSPSTAQEDLGPKKALYEQTFRTTDYFCYDPDEQKLYGWHLGEEGYVPLASDEQGRLWSAELEAWLGLWEGAYLQRERTWLRLFEVEGRLLLTEAEATYEQAETERQRAEAEHQRAEAERQRAEAAEAENVRLREELARYQAGSEADA